MGIPTQGRLLHSRRGKQPLNTFPMSWAVDLVLTIQEEGVRLSPALQHLVPLSGVVVWAQELQALPPVPEIAERWGVHRATAYRWLSDLRRARKAVGKA